MDLSEDDFFLAGSSSDEAEADDEWTDRSARYTLYATSMAPLQIAGPSFYFWVCQLPSNKSSLKNQKCRSSSFTTVLLTNGCECTVTILEIDPF